MNPDLEEFTDATMRLFVASWDMRAYLQKLVDNPILALQDIERARGILSYIEKG